MKIQWYKRLICYVFIAILSVSGMQVDFNNSHSYFACEPKETSNQPQYINTQTVISSDYCTTELLQPRNTQYIKNNSPRKHTIRRLRNFVLTSTPSTVKHNLFYLEEIHLSNILCSSSSQNIIIEYIHLQDGAK